MEKYKVGVIGGTGMVGQRFITLMENHPWFQLTVIAASPRSAGKPYREAVGSRWAMTTPIPLEARELIKGRVLENALMSAREAAEALAPLTRSEVVQVIGTKFVLYRQSHRKDKKDKIVLVEGKKRESVPQREP